jgi:hypothetical protein
MDPEVPIPLYPPTPEDLDLSEIAGAIELVARGVATRVFISSLRHPERVADQALAIAQGAGVRFALQRDGRSGAVTVVVGPRIET